MTTAIRNALSFLLVLFASSVACAGLVGTVTYYHTNLVGSPVAATSQANELVWTTDYLPYGEKYATGSNSGSNRVWFGGHVQDAPAGLVYMEARYYDPEIGRFMAIDPAGVDERLPQSFNRYAYANNNPISNVDRNGLWGTKAHNAIIDRAFANVPKALRAQIKAGSKHADSLVAGYQGGDYAYMHAMTSSSLNEAASREKMAEFIRTGLGKYRENMILADRLAAEGNQAASDSARAAAYFELGFAIHPIMDSTSPSHAGFKLWRYRDMKDHGDFFSSSEENLDALNSRPDLMDLSVKRIEDALSGSE